MRFASAAPRSRGRAVTAAMAFILFLTALAIAPVPAIAVPDETFADDFSPAGFDGSDGTLPWATDWVETGESDGFDAGTIQVRNEPHCETDPCLTLGRAAGPDASVERQADLSEFASATLTFYWDVHQHGLGWGTASLWISDGGGSDWDHLETWALTDEASNQTATYDISDYLAADTRIRFSVNNNWDDSHLNIDNLEIGVQYWGEQTTPTSEDLWTVQFPVDDQIGYVGGGSGVILKTVDGGETWVEQTTPATSTVRGIDFPVNATTGYAVGSSDTVMKTTNGVDWVMQTTPTDVTLEGVDFVDNATGFAVGDGGTILKTTNGGATWVGKPSGTSENLRGVTFPVDALTGYAVGTNGTILKTIDGGDTWQPQSSGTSRNLNAVQFPVDLNNGYVVANSGELLKTVDGGTNWTSSTPGSDDLRALHFPQDSQHGHVATDNGKVLATESSGSIWATEPVPTSLDLLGIWFTGLNRGWVVGRDGLIYATGPSSIGPGGNSPPVFDQDLLDRSDAEGTIIDIDAPTNTNQAPSIANPGNQLGAEGSPFSVVVTASDPDGTTVGFSDGGTLPAWATLTDNGDDTATISGTPGYSDAGTTTVTITVSDGPETDDAVFDITISNTNRAPAVDPISDQIVAENDPFALIVTASDPDGTIPSLAQSGLPGWASFVDNGDGTGAITGTPGFGDSGLSTVTITASDGTLPGFAVFDLTVTDTNRAPVVNPIADQLVAEGAALVPLMVSASDPDGTIPALAATGLPTWASFADNGDGTGTLTGTPGYDDAAVTAVTITAEDGGIPNLADSKTFDLTVTDTNRAPSFDQDLLDRTDPEGSTISLSAAATDPDLDGLSYVAVSLPPGLSINPTSGLITGTLTYAATGVYPVEITVTDDGTPALGDTDTFQWTVTNTNRAPAVDPIPDQVVAETNLFTLTVTGSDPDGDSVGFSDSGTLPTWATLTDNGDNTATISGTPGYSDAGIATVVVAVNDGFLTADAQFDLQVTDTNRPPVVNPVPDQAAVEFESIAPVVVTASDPDGTIPSLVASGLPSWAIFTDHGNGTGTLAGTPGSGDAGVSSVTITASDGDLVASDTFEITVAEGNRPPSFGMSLPDRSDAEGDVIFIAATASDLDGDDLTYSATGLPAGITIDLVSGEIAGMLSYTSAGSYTVEVAVDDDGVPPLRASATFIWTVADTNRAPILAPLASVLGPEMTELTFTAAATDPDGHDVAYSIAGAPPGATIDPATGIFTWTPDEVHGEGSFAVTVVATDSGVPNLADTKTVTITVTEANRPPTVDPISDQQDTIGDSVELQVVATDPDIPVNSITYAASGLPSGLSIDENTGAITGRVAADAADTNYVTVTVTDDGSPAKSGKTTFKWVVGDENRPPVMDQMSDRTVAELTPVTIQPSVTDPDGDTITYEIAGAPPGSSFDPATGTLRWTPSEEQGPGTYRFSIIAADDGDPELVSIGVVTVNVTELNSAPSIEDPLDRADDAGDTVSLQIVAEDSDIPANTLSFAATELPPGLEIDPATGLIGGQIEVTTEEVTSYTVTVTVSDDGEPALEAETAFTWTIIGQDVVPENFPPSVDPVAAQFSDAGTSVELPVQASDTDPLTYLAEGLPAGLSIDPTTGLISGTVTPEAMGTHAVVITVADSAEPPLRTAVSFTWTVTDRAAADQKDDVVVTIVDVGAAPGATDDDPNDVQARPLRRGLVVMSTAAAATTQSLQLPFALLLALMAGFATIGRIGLYPLLWRGERHTGTISFYDDEIGFGLIHPDEGGEAVFVHSHAFPRKQRGLLVAGLRLRYRVLSGDNRASAWGATLEGVDDE